MLECDNASKNVTWIQSIQMIGLKTISATYHLYWQDEIEVESCTMATA